MVGSALSFSTTLMSFVAHRLRAKEQFFFPFCTGQQLLHHYWHTDTNAFSGHSNYHMHQDRQKETPDINTQEYFSVQHSLFYFAFLLVGMRSFNCTFILIKLKWLKKTLSKAFCQIARAIQKCINKSITHFRMTDLTLENCCSILISVSNPNMRSVLEVCCIDMNPLLLLSQPFHTFRVIL